MTDSASDGIRFEDGIQPANSREKQLPFTESSSTSDNAAADVDDLQKKFADQDLNHKKKQTYHGWILMWLAYQSTGVIYGDIGTSPLYVYSSTFSSQPSWDDLVGALSIIIWSLTLMVTIKYVFIVLSADDDGEGGTFALYSLLSRYVHIARRDPNVAGTIKMERYLTDDLKTGTKGLRWFLEHSRVAKNALKIIGVVGVSLVMADGVLTPAQSVLGAIQGINVVSPDISSSTIIGSSCAILIVIFLLQPFGIVKITVGFSPIVAVWLLFNLSVGIYNIAKYDFTVLKAFSPYFAGAYLVRNKEDGWRSLGGLLLAFTGVEALFADLGAFSKRAIQISWLCFTFPCLLVAYIGQAAYISAHPDDAAYANPFFLTLPPGTLIFGLIIAILAAIVASQAMITSSFQLLHQVMAMSYFPHIKTIHTSKLFHGQVYMPLPNFLLMIGTVIVTAVYSNTTSLGNAYGVCVILVTFITTCMVTLVALLVWRLPVVIALLFFLIFGLLDGVYLSSALTKIPTGAWFTVVLSAILASIFVLWRYGKDSQWAAEASDRYSPSHLLTTNEDGELKFTDAFGGAEIRTVAGLGVFFDKSGDKVPTVFAQFVLKFMARTEVVVFFHMRALPVPTVGVEERYVITATRGIPNCYRITLRHGYADQVVTPDLGHMLAQQLVSYITRDPTATLTDADGDSGTGVKGGKYSPEIAKQFEALGRAAESQTVYIMGKEQMKIRKGTNIVRRLFLELFLWIRDNSRTKMADLNVPVDRLVEVGFVKEI